MTAAEKVIGIALAEEGYHEVGENITKYAAEIDRTAFNNGPKNGFAWCAVFQEWCFLKAFGERKAMDMLYIPNGSSAAGCEFWMQYFIGAGAFHKGVPKPGELIFFYSGGGVNHMGMVYKVEEAVVYTIEGNSGDRVRRNSYMVSDRTIVGYGTPNWALVEEQTEEPTTEGPRRNYLCLQKGDGMNHPMDRVRALQNLLRVWGYTLIADGEFGNDTESTVKDFQRRVGLPDNGIVTELEWKELIFVEE